MKQSVFGDNLSVSSVVGKKRSPWTCEKALECSDNSERYVWPKMSIVTPSYNQGRFLEETIRSVVLQGYPNLEYLVVDGGSTDSSLRIIQSYKECLAFWVSETDRGQSHAVAGRF